MQIGLVLAATGGIKFAFGNLLLFGLLFKTLLATLSDMNLYYVVSKLLIWPAFGQQIENE